MYFVTTKHPDYVLFCMTPSERAAIGLTDKQVVHLLVRAADAAWRVRHTWDANRLSHTEFMEAMHYRDEPNDPEDLLALLPSDLR